MFPSLANSVGISVVNSNNQSLGNFTPKSLSGLLVWLRSDLGITLNSGNVQNWADQSGNGNDFSQIVAASQQPLYNATDAQYNNLPSIQFNGINNILKSAALTYGVYTIVIVARMTGASTKYFYIRDPATTTPSETLYGNTGATIYINRGGSVSAHNLSVNWGLSAAPRTLTQRFNGTNASNTLRINGVDQSLTDVVAGDPGVANATQPMYIFSDNVSYFGAGTVAEFIIYNRSLSDVEAQQVEAYLKSRYNHY